MTDIEKLQRYLRGELSPSEASSLEEHLNKNEEDLRVLEGLKLLNEDKGEDNALDFLRNAEEEGLKEILALDEPPSEAAQPRANRNVMKWVAAVTVLVAATFLLVNEFTGANNDELISGFLAVDDPDNLKKRTDVVSEAWVNALLADDYASMVSILSAKEGKSSREILYLGLAKMNLNNYRGAIEDWAKVDKLSLSFQKARYYSALCYWQLGNRKEATRLFKTILNDVKSYGYDEVNQLDL